VCSLLAARGRPCAKPAPPFDCLLELPGHLPIFVIVDAVDEYPITAGTICSGVEDVVGSNHLNLFICITCRPEQDIQAILNPLTPTSRRIFPHEEAGQREDIDNYVRSFIYGDRAMRRWRTDDKELVINTPLGRADGL
jgi:hypothetical protein